MVQAAAASQERFSVARAVVLAVAGDAAMVRLRDGRAVRASIEGAPGIRAGDSTVVGADADGWFVLPSPSTLSAPNGGSASLEDDALVVRDKEGRCLLSYRDGETILHSTSDLSLIADRTIRLRAREGVMLESEHSTLSLEPGALRVNAEKVSAQGDRADLTFKETQFTGVSFVSVVDRAKHVVGVAELRAGRIVERAKRVYREADELSHLKAGRIRQIADGAMQLFAGRAVLKADEDVAIKAEKIHLA